MDSWGTSRARYAYTEDMWLVRFLRSIVQVLADHFTFVFDAVKRREMSKKYRLPDPWGRQRHTSDVDAALSLLPDARYGTCLDVGTGLGHYAERIGPVCEQVIAIDVCPAAIARARARLHAIPNLDFQTRNIRRFTGASEPFDLIILGDVLYYLGDREFPNEFDHIVGKIVSFLSPGGRILMSHYVSSDRPEREVSAYTAAFERRGLTIERSRRFNDGENDWTQAVLRK